MELISSSLSYPINVRLILRDTALKDMISLISLSSRNCWSNFITCAAFSHVETIDSAIPLLQTTPNDSLSIVSCILSTIREAVDSSVRVQKVKVFPIPPFFLSTQSSVDHIQFICLFYEYFKKEKEVYMKTSTHS